REREYSGNSSASTASSRRPAAATGTSAWRAAGSVMGEWPPAAARPRSGWIKAMGWYYRRSSRPSRPGADSMPITPRSALLRPVLVLAFVLAASGCAGPKNKFKDKDKNAGVPVSELYDRAHGQMEKSRWSSANETFGRLVAQYPYGPYTEQALIEQAYAQYKAGRHEDAISTIDRFIRTYPTHKNIAYLYYLRGL